MTERILVLPDTHWPDTDRRIWKTVLNAVREVKPDKIIHIGDLMDYPQPSRWTKGTRFEFEGSVFKDSEDAVENFIKPLRQVYDGPIGVHEGNHDCLDTKTRAVTNEGLKYLDELTGDEQVLTVDDDGNSVWQSINKIVRYDHSGSMFRIEGPSISALITRNHRIVGLDKRKQRWVETTPETMSADRVYCYAAGKGYEPALETYSTEEIRLAAWCLTDSYYDSKYDTWALYQSGDAAKVTQQLLDDLDIEYRLVARQRDTTEIAGVELSAPPKKSYEFHFKSRTASSLVPDKNRVPEWVWDLSESQFRVFLNELVFCDGTDYQRGSSKVLYVCRKELREDLMILCAMNGIRANAYEYRPGHWRLNISDESLTGVYRSKITEEHYEGEVWCLQVPNERFFIERDGKIHLTGNCRPRKYMEKYAPALAETEEFHFEKLLRFDEFEIERLPDFNKIAPGWVTTHGHLAKIRLSQIAGNTPLNAAKKLGQNIVMGHTHRAGISSFTMGLDGSSSTLTGMEVGHILNPKKATYLEGYAGNWQQSLGWLTIDGRHVTPSLVPIQQSKFTIEGRVFKI